MSGSDRHRFESRAIDAARKDDDMTRNRFRSLVFAATIVVAASFVACDSTPSADGGVASGSPAQEPESSTPFDPLGGAYPQISWMINIAEVEGPIGLARGGEIVPLDDPTRARAESMVFGERHERVVFDSLRSAPGYRLLSAPFVMSRPEQSAEIGIDSSDKAGLSTGNVSTKVKGVIAGTTIHADIECVRGAGAGSQPWQRVDGSPIPEGGGIVIIGPIAGGRSASARPVWGVVVVRPGILRSVDDYPFQRSESLSNER